MALCSGPRLATSMIQRIWGRRPEPRNRGVAARTTLPQGDRDLAGLVQSTSSQLFKERKSGTAANRTSVTEEGSHRQSLLSEGIHN